MYGTTLHYIIYSLLVLYDINFYYGSEIEPLKMEMLNKYNDTDDKTLEEEMVSKMAPIKQDSTDPASYKPTLNSIEGGFAPINYEGVI